MQDSRLIKNKTITQQIQQLYQKIQDNTEIIQHEVGDIKYALIALIL